MGTGLTIGGYSPQQLAKALVAALTSIVALLGLAAQVFTDGPLATVGAYAAAALLVATPLLVFAQRAAPMVDDTPGRHAAQE